MGVKGEYPGYIDEALRRLGEEDHLRRLVRVPSDSIDFCSNDYLGLARKAVPDIPSEEGHPIAIGWGSGGSRLLAGNQDTHELLEAECAAFFRSGSALLFSSGYLANLALLSALPRRGDTILMDEFVHASLREGARLSLAHTYTFRHNDLPDLERLIRKGKGNVFVVTEALFSMDGDLPPLAEIAVLCKREGAWLILDEAHSTGVMGDSGRGLACELKLESGVLARVHTFGKAVGRMGAVIVSSDAVVQYLINKARPFIYTTAMPGGMAVLISNALKETALMDAERNHLRLLRKKLGEEMKAGGRWILPEGDSPIVPVIIPGNSEVRKAAAALQQQGFDVRAVLSPTVPVGTERLRLILHAFNTEAEVRQLVAALHQ